MEADGVPPRAARPAPGSDSGAPLTAVPSVGSRSSSVPPLPGGGAPGDARGVGHAEDKEHGDQVSTSVGGSGGQAQMTPSPGLKPSSRGLKHAGLDIVDDKAALSPSLGGPGSPAEGLQAGSESGDGEAKVAGQTGGAERDVTGLPLSACEGDSRDKAFSPPNCPELTPPAPHQGGGAASTTGALPAAASNGNDSVPGTASVPPPAAADKAGTAAAVTDKAGTAVAATERPGDATAAVTPSAALDKEQRTTPLKRVPAIIPNLDDFEFGPEAPRKLPPAAAMDASPGPAFTLAGGNGGKEAAAPAVGADSDFSPGTGLAKAADTATVPADVPPLLLAAPGRAAAAPSPGEIPLSSPSSSATAAAAAAAAAASPAGSTTTASPAVAAAAAASAAEERQQQLSQEEEEEGDERRINLAACDDGAAIIAANKEAKYADRAIDDDGDSYVKNLCSAHKWLLIELSQVCVCVGGGGG